MDCSYISIPPSLQHLLYELFPENLRDDLKRWGVLQIHFQYLTSKACFKICREGVSYIDFARPEDLAHGLLRLPWNRSLPRHRRPPTQGFLHQFPILAGGEGHLGGRGIGRGGKWSLIHVCTWEVYNSESCCTDILHEGCCFSFSSIVRVQFSIISQELQNRNSYRQAVDVPRCIQTSFCSNVFEVKAT